MYQNEPSFPPPQDKTTAAAAGHINMSDTAIEATGGLQVLGKRVPVKSVAFGILCAVVGFVAGMTVASACEGEASLPTGMETKPPDKDNPPTPPKDQAFKTFQNTRHHPAETFRLEFVHLPRSPPTRKFGSHPGSPPQRPILAHLGQKSHF